MYTPQPLPIPPPQALQHSQRLEQYIAQAIRKAGGSIPFRQFIHMALYQPDLGYYVAGQEKFGAAGDFVTAPEISPLFSHCIANHCAAVFAQLDRDSSCNQSNENTEHSPRKDSTKAYEHSSTPNARTILELGAGSGIMAADILLRLEQLDALPQQYLILEPGAELRQRQRETLQQHCPQLLGRVRWLQDLPEQPIRGIMLANEVMDAMPVELFSVTGPGHSDFISDASTRLLTDLCIQNIHVARHDDETFHLQPVVATPEQTEYITQTCINCWEQAHKNFHPQQAYQSEYNPSLTGWINSLNDTLAQGEILLIDYGYERSDYYRPERSQGTLLCHYRHHVHDNPLLWPGLQDITCSVDFTAVAEAADGAELTIAAYQTQADFLFSTGLESLFNAELEQHPERQYQLAQQVRTLTLPAEMGERFKVMRLTKGFTPEQQTHTLTGLEQMDRRHRL